MTPDPQTISPLCRALLCLLETRRARGIETHCCYPTSALLRSLRNHGGDARTATGFPVNAQRLGMALNKEKTTLREAGIIAAYKRSHKFGRLWMIGASMEFESEADLLEEFLYVFKRPVPQINREREQLRRFVDTLERFFRSESGS